MTDMLSKSTIVMDCGSGYLKAGLQGEEKPKIIVPSYVGRPKYPKVLPYDKQQDYHIGEDTEINRGLLKLNYPMNKGIIENWNDMECIWNYAFSQMKVKPNEHPIFLTEPIENSFQEKEKIAQHFFESYGAPALFFGQQPILSLFATGKTSGIVLECGDSMTQIAVVYQGYYLKHANQRIDIGGRDMTEQLRVLLRRSGYSFNTSSEIETVKKMKEEKVRIQPSKKTDEKMNQIKEQYTLPDGSQITLNLNYNSAAEVLFDPQIIGLEYPSIPQLFINSVMKVDMDIRKQLHQEIVLSGGTVLQQGFPVRFLNEIKKMAPKDIKFKSYAPNISNKLCWTGGSILSGLQYFKNMWITKEEYQENGSKIFLQKSL